MHDHVTLSSLASISAAFTPWFLRMIMFAENPDGNGARYLDREYPHNPQKLIDLPMETLVHILSFLSSRAIITLRMCCKALAAVSGERTVWLTATRQVCEDYGVYACTYPMEKMSALELEHVATSHHRFSARLSTEFGAEPLAPTLTRIIHPCLPRNSILPAPIDVYHSKLVPGGRFLLTCSENGILQLWDLSLASNAFASPHPLTSTEIIDYDGTGLLIQPTSDQLGILVLLSVTGPSDIQIQFNVYEVFPLSDSPIFRLASSFLYTFDAADDHLGINSACFLSDRFAFHDGWRVVVWNYIKNSFVIWHSETESDAIIIFDTDLFLMTTKEFWIFRIPDLQPYMPGSEPVIMPEKPAFRLVYPFAPAYMCSPGIHCHSPAAPHYVDLISTNATLARFEISTVSFKMKTVDQVAIDTHHGHLPVLINAFEDHGFGIGRNVGYVSSFCDYNMLLHKEAYSADGRSQVKARFTIMAANSGIGLSHHWGTLWNGPPNVDSWHYDLCSMSGRLCAVILNEIRIIDYLKPLT